MKNKKGFTMVELVVVLVILAILAAVLIPTLSGYIKKARSAQALQNASSVMTACTFYVNEQLITDEPNKEVAFDHAADKEDAISIIKLAGLTPGEAENADEVGEGDSFLWKLEFEDNTEEEPGKITSIVYYYITAKDDEGAAGFKCEFKDGAWTATEIGTAEVEELFPEN